MSTPGDPTTHEQHMQQNYAAFMAQLPTLVLTQRGKFALMHEGKIIEFFDTARDAYIAGQHLFPGTLVSIQEVIETPIDLGCFSHAMPQQAL